MTGDPNLAPGVRGGKLGGVRVFPRTFFRRWLDRSAGAAAAVFGLFFMLGALAAEARGGAFLCALLFSAGALWVAVDELIKATAIRADDEGLQYWSWRGRRRLEWRDVTLVGYAGPELVVQGSPRGLRLRLDRFRDGQALIDLVRTSVEPRVFRLSERDERALLRGRSPQLGQHDVPRMVKAPPQPTAGYRDAADARVPTREYATIAGPRVVLWIVGIAIGAGVMGAALVKHAAPGIVVPAILGSMVAMFVIGRLWAHYTGRRELRRIEELFGPEVRPLSDGYLRPDGAWRYRRSLLDDADPFFGPHAHFEELDPESGEVTRSFRVGLDLVQPANRVATGRAFAVVEPPVPSDRFFEGPPRELGGKPKAREASIAAVLITEHREGVVLHRFDGARRSIGDTLHGDREGAEAQARAELGEALGGWRDVYDVSAPLAWWPSDR